jgi:hypothetical protein
METRHEACSAEGQPRNILDRNPNRFAARCPALSRRCHCVIHSCYAFRTHFCEIPLVSTPDKTIIIADAASSGLTMHERAGAFCFDRKRRRALFIISKPRHALLRRAVRVR